MNRIKAFFYLDKSWFKELYVAQHNLPLRGEDIYLLSEYNSKKHLQDFLESKGFNLYAEEKLPLKLAANYLRMVKNG